jgi:uncharacterized protein (DUF302 family)/uncharacterized membrane protein YidH (DUF202 family)
MQAVVDSREFLAEERTLLAWLRTSLGIAGLGFVLDRFSLFLRAMQISTGVAPGHLPHVQGIWFVLLAFVVNVLAISRHLVTIRAMRRAGLASAAPQSPVLVVAVLLTLLTAALGLSVIPSARADTPRRSESMDIGEGIIRKPSTRTVPETLDRLEATLKAKGITVFARVDHSGEAAKVGLTMPPTQVLIFGNPKAGTPVMLAAPTSAIDLPLKALAWQDGAGKVWLGYTDPAYLARRYGLTEAQVAPLAGIGQLIDAAVR